MLYMTWNLLVLANSANPRCDATHYSWQRHAMPYSAQKYVLGRETEKSMHTGITQKIYFYIGQIQIIHSHIHAQGLMICHKSATS